MPKIQPQFRAHAERKKKLKKIKAKRHADEAARRMLSPDDTALLIVDVQEKFFPAMPESCRGQHLKNMVTLATAAERMGMPVVVTEQVPEKLGPTVEELRRAHPKAGPVEKRAFSCCGEDAPMNAIRETKREKLLVVGLETHICVYQTVIDLLEHTRIVPHVVADAVLSRHKANWRRGLEMIRDAGGVLSTTETALFQLLGTADHEHFRELSKLIR